MPLLSIIVPCYNEEEMLPIFIDELKKELDKIEIDKELIFINDGSRDRTLSVLKTIQEENDNLVTVINLSRNFGKESAMLAGMEESHGDYVVIMDADLQDPPALLNKMLERLEDEYCDSVATYRVTRKGEPVIRSFFARKFYKMINKISDTKIVDGARDYRMMKRSMVDSILAMPEYHRFSKGIFSWVGYHTEFIEFENVERAAGETSWSFWGLFKYAIEGIIAFTTAPLRISTFMGVIFSFLSFLMLILIIVRRILFGDPVDGWASTVSIVIFIGAVQMLSIGIMGEYLAKTYMESKRRPNYFIRNIYKKEDK